MQFAVANPFTCLLPSGDMIMWKNFGLKTVAGKQITMKLSSASSEICGSARSMCEVMSVSKEIEKSFTQ